ncbi:glycoside hydrolase family 64 protein [Chaetomidium leptoderma]|uniref:Glycoside hydrolase family 64 protein n=1 Tax=Chaetomidium leptoderma TaxID=669021 RepID=A0AAN6VTW8_9PEZI|nr:glycoside hydrolase family 64 protein [Chaetomidium leptoderma]
MPESLEIQLQNQTNSEEVYAYITGLALQDNNARVLVQANGTDLYFPSSPDDIMSELEEDCAIPLGPPGSTTTARIPQLAGGRIWFSVDGKLTFLLNPGPALVEPSPFNPSDPNADVDFAFAELTLNRDQLFANISYVDFVPRLPVALTLQTEGGEVQHVSGMAADGLERVCEALRAQTEADGMPWDQLILNQQSSGDGAPLRALNPTHANAVGASFDGYYEAYVDSVWERWGAEPDSLSVNTQASAGTLAGFVDENGALVVGDEVFEKPDTRDIFGCNSGPFTTGRNQTRNAIIPRLAAGFVRSSLLESAEQPSDPSTFYLADPTNHYSRIVHEVNLDNKGYAFAYDDVQPDGGADQSGKVNAGDPAIFIVAVGGNNAYAGDEMQEF